MANAQLKFLLVSLCILVTHTTKGAFGVITKAPLNSVVCEGATNVTITCESNDPVLDWSLSPFGYTGTFSYIDLTTNGEFNSNFGESFAIDHPQGTQVYTLIVFKSTLYPPDGWGYSTAGAYQCYSYNADSVPSAAASLVVLRTDPVCSSNITQSTEMLQSGDVIQLSCTIVYGAWRSQSLRIDAIMTWSVNGQLIPNGNATFAVNSSPTEVTASSTLLISDNYDATYECRTTFSQPEGGPSGTATNAPDYSKTCTISLSQPTAESTTNKQTMTCPLSSTTTAEEVTSTTAQESSAFTSTTTTTPAPSTTTTTATTTTTSVPASAITTGLPPCTGLFHFVSDLLKASCYTDWIVCSLEINILGITLWPDCGDHCKSLYYNGGTCTSSSTSVGCPCIHPGNVKCQCS